MPIRDYPIPKKYDAGILIYGENNMVPEYEAREAAVYCNYNWVEFQAVDPVERAKSVAQYRCHYLIESNMNNAAETASNRSANK